MKAEITKEAIEKYNSYPEEERKDLDYLDGYIDGATSQHQKDIKNACNYVCTDCNRHRSCKLKKSDCNKIRELYSFLGGDYEE